MHIEPALSIEARRVRLCRTSASLCLGCDWNSSLTGDGRFDLRADALTLYIKVQGSDVVSDVLADLVEVAQPCMKHRQEA